MRPNTIRAAVVLSVSLLFSLPMAAEAGGDPPAPTLRARLPQLPLIGDPAPEFEAESTRGTIQFPKDYEGKWVILFSHPGDFTPVCTSEFIAFGAKASQFEQRNAALIGLSTDSLDHHRRWKAAIRDEISHNGVSKLEIPFPIIADEDGEIAWRYGMLHPGADTNRTVRAVFVIDPAGKIRSLLFYPHTTGRNIAEIERLLIALQTADGHRVATPADWTPGADVIVPKPDQSDPKAAQTTCQTDYFCTRPLPRSELGVF